MPHSDVYNRIVKDDNDIAGQIAYAVYKRTKQEFIRRVQAEQGTVLIPDEVLEEFYANQTDYTIDLYRKHAASIIREFLDEATDKELSREKQKLSQEYITKYHKLASNSSFWSGVLQGITASFLFVLSGYIILKMNGSWDILLSNLFK
ncbi:MAG: hypothetical protein IJS39_14515 [Synergistaceae bacterium]|nr:hypothetical protein [Synergistaceae bacterium]